jgi:hypothetical protein
VNVCFSTAIFQTNTGTSQFDFVRGKIIDVAVQKKQRKKTVDHDWGRGQIRHDLLFVALEALSHFGKVCKSERDALDLTSEVGFSLSYLGRKFYTWVCIFIPRYVVLYLGM